MRCDDSENVLSIARGIPNVEQSDINVLVYALQVLLFGCRSRKSSKSLTICITPWFWAINAKASDISSNIRQDSPRPMGRNLS